jgi:hypothetical protein
MWPSAVVHVLRRAALEVDEKDVAKAWVNDGIPQHQDEAIGTPTALDEKYLVIGNRVDRIADAFENQGPRRAQTGIPDRYPLIKQVASTHLRTEPLNTRWNFACAAGRNQKVWNIGHKDRAPTQ